MDGSNRVKDFERKYKERIESQLRDYKEPKVEARTSRHYNDFKKDYLPTHITVYEKACNFAEKFFKVTPDKGKRPAMQEAIDITHMNCTPEGISSLALLAPVIIILFSIFVSFVMPLLLNFEMNAMLGLVGILLGLISIIVFQKIPFLLASNWRMKASNQMVLCVFYVVTFMRHTSNLENAINFAAEHLNPPLSVDMKKIMWDIETEKYSTIKDSLEAYLDTWKKWNMEFVEAMHLIESSLYESSEDRRVTSLDKSLSTILEETYDKMLHYAHNLQSPLTMLHMLGIVLPILGLVILPLAVSFVDGLEWYHLFAIYNVALPAGVYYLSKVILSTRPSGYGETDISNNPEIKKFKNVLVKVGKTELKIPPLYLAILLFMVLLLIGTSPLLIHATQKNFDIAFSAEDGLLILNELTHPTAQYYLLGYVDTDNNPATPAEGPYGLGASLLSLFITLSFGVSIGYYYKTKSKNVIKIRNETKKIEEEFASALFQLGNKLGDDLPVEIAFEKVSQIMQGTHSAKFFDLVTDNMRKLGMRVEDAIFDPKKGAVIFFPSPIIESSMKVLVESSKKGTKIAAQALLNVSQYIKEMHRVDERLRDLMADIISSMKSQIAFLTPAIAGIVIGITSMITTILGSLGQQLTNIQNTGTVEGASGFGNLFENFLGYGIPTFQFQFIVGLYVVQIVYILTILVNGIQNGSDVLNERYMLGKNMITSIVLYCFLAFGVTIVFNLIAGQIVGSVNLGAG